MVQWRGRRVGGQLRGRPRGHRGARSERRRQVEPVADAVQSLLSEKPLSAVEKNHISDLLNEQDVEPLFKALAITTACCLYKI